MRYIYIEHGTWFEKRRQDNSGVRVTTSLTDGLVVVTTSLTDGLVVVTNRVQQERDALAVRREGG
jgi:hypothetical protein